MKKSRHEFYPTLLLVGRKSKTESITNKIGSFLLPWFTFVGEEDTGCDCVKTENVHFGALSNSRDALSICVNQKFEPDDDKKA